MSRARKRKNRARTAAKRELLDRVLRLYVARIREIFKDRAPGYYANAPEAKRPCSTCALAPHTDDWPGFDSTMFHLARALEDGRPFFCHENLPKLFGGWRFDASVAKLCGAFSVIERDERARFALAHAALSVDGLEALEGFL